MQRLDHGLLLFLLISSPVQASFTSLSRGPFAFGNVARGSSSPGLSWRRPTCRPRSVAGSQRRDTSVDRAVGGGEPKAEAALSELSEERKASLFQFLLRDLQIEGVPLLSVDVPDNADSPLFYPVLQAALWTTMAELADQQSQPNLQQQENDQDSDKSDDEDAAAPVLNRACLVIENTSVQDLQRFVDHFEQTLKPDSRATANFPELTKIRLSLVGKGVGPGLLVEATNATSSSVEPAADSTQRPEAEHRAVAAMKMFVDRRGYLGKDSDVNVNTYLATLQYRTCSFRDAYHIHSAFWNCVCELVQASMNEPSPQQQAHPSSTYLLFPELDDLMQVENQQERFDVLTSMLTRSLELYNTESKAGAIEVMYSAPQYDRTKIHPADAFVPGHLPPLSWVGHDASIDTDASLWNYQRRSPVTACLLRLPPKQESNIQDGTAAESSTAGDLEPSCTGAAVKRAQREHLQLVWQTLEQAAAAERDVARGT
jgi:hypothetical protein